MLTLTNFHANFPLTLLLVDVLLFFWSTCVCNHLPLISRALSLSTVPPRAGSCPKSSDFQKLSDLNTDCRFGKSVQNGSKRCICLLSTGQRGRIRALDYSFLCAAVYTRRTAVTQQPQVGSRCGLNHWISDIALVILSYHSTL